MADPYASFLRHSILASATVVGPSHHRDGTPNQDAFACFRGPELLVVAAADGLGSAERANLGSQYAVESTIEAALDFVSHPADGDPATHLGTGILKRWINSCEGDYHSYDTTLLFSVITRGEFFIGQVGDGLIIYKGSGGAFIQFPVFEKSFLNFPPNTMAVAARAGELSVREVSGTLNGSLVSLLLMTDGVADDLSDPAAYAGDLVQSLHAEPNWNRRLEEHLMQWPTPGHFDDKTILAALLRDPALGSWREGQTSAERDSGEKRLDNLEASTSK